MSAGAVSAIKARILTEVAGGNPAMLDLKVDGVTWVTNSHWIARAARVPSDSLSIGVLGEDGPAKEARAAQTVSDLHRMRREEVRRVDGLPSTFEGKTGTSQIDPRYVPLLDGLSVVRLHGKYTVAGHGENKLAAAYRPVAGIDADGRIVVVVMPFIPASVLR